MSETWYTVGKLVNTHGIRGDVKILSQTDFADLRFAPGSKLTLMNDAETEQIVVTITHAREQKGMYVVHFAGFDNINDVEKYKGWQLKISGADQGELDDGEYYFHQIIGCTVLLESGETLGVISEILTPGANDVWVISNSTMSREDILLPVIDEVVIDVNIAKKEVVVKLMEGLV
ncbi:ribosome maturation factor RimM [Paenibacillus yanchengensis]|uniref:Ribosome maturation factor RimM n=1 Tax=Paenibacillus yanchengensis TaxID=2035833 RepID=A0ABW4YN17_9BACL